MSRIYRHAEPNQYDEAPRGSTCFVTHFRDRDVYLQVGEENAPRWEFIANFMNEVELEVIDEIIEKRLHS